MLVKKIMVFPTTEALTPSLTSRLSADTRAKWKEHYRIAKKYGIRTAFSGVIGTGLVSLAKEAAVDGIKRHGKRYIGGILLNGGLTCISGGLPLIICDYAIFGEYVPSCGESDYDFIQPEVE